MEYRLLCIYKCNKNVVEQVDIEVNRELHTSTLAPFMRKVSVEELAYSEVRSPKELVWLLNQCGYDKQPFILKGNILRIPDVQDVLAQDKCSYKQEGRGSLKKFSVFPLQASYRQLRSSTLLGGELYITNLANWKDHIKVRLVYANAIRPFYPIYNELPCRTSNGVLFNRDKDEELKLLADIEPYFDTNGLNISLPTYDVEFLKGLSEKHWKVYVVGDKGMTSEVHAHQNSSGIVWFDRNERVDDKDGIVNQMLDSYLHGRNYIELRNNIGIFRSKDVVNQEDHTISDLIPDDSQAINDIYSPNTQLTEKEISTIDSRIEEGVSAELRPYQRNGVLWLATMRKNHKGCLLADEMGLGKTLQVLSHLYAISNIRGPFLVIAPTSLLPSWESEIKRFIPSWSDDITIQSHNPSKDSKIILVSYDILRLNIAAYKKLDYDTIVIDEAQIVKNRDTKKYQTIAQLKAYHRIILTGTPIENSINDIWSHFMILMPPLRKVFKAITKNDVSVDSPQFMELSKKLLKPFILRRTKSEVLKNMPDLDVETVYIKLTPTERTIYNNVKGIFIKSLQTGVSGRLNSIILEVLQRLRQACISPNLLPTSLYHGQSFKSSKMKKALQLIRDSMADGQKVLVFSQFVKALEELDGYLNEMSIGHVHLYGDTTNRRACVSAFQNDSNIFVFLISLKAGGVGLNLTSATRVILMDDWWNPAVEDQAFARAHRIGQKHNVQVSRLVCKDTIEEKVLQLQDKKRQTVDIFNANGGKLTLGELKNLLD